MKTLKKICLRCGRVFEGHQQNTYCPECFEIQRRIVTGAKVCKICGKEFEGGPTAMYCPECRPGIIRERSRRYYANGSRRPIGSAAVCERCGREYPISAPMQKYCKNCIPIVNKEKARKYQYEYYQKNRDRIQGRKMQSTAPRTCVVCGRPFKPKANTLTCSPECRKIRKDQKLEERKAKARKGTKEMNIYNVCVSESLNYNDRDAFVSDLALSSIWEDEEGAEIPQERIERLGGIWDASHRSLKDIAKAAKLSQRALAERFCVPQRTMEDWCRGVSKCPIYTRLMMQECLGLIKR